VSVIIIFGWGRRTNKSVFSTECQTGILVALHTMVNSLYRSDNHDFNEISDHLIKFQSDNLNCSLSQVLFQSCKALIWSCKLWKLQYPSSLYWNIKQTLMLICLGALHLDSRPTCWI
jgi:hypothetical protein